MTRKEFLRNALFAGASVAALPVVSRAMEAGNTFNAQASLTAEVVIGNNHGHLLELTTESLVLALRESQATGFVDFDIQGESRHPHTLRLTQLDLVKILAEGGLEKESSVDRGHAHLVSIQLLSQES